MEHYFPTYQTKYRGYGINIGSKRCIASTDTPELYDKCDYPNIGYGWPVDRGIDYDYDSICKRIDEVIAEREKRIGWVREFAQTTKKPDWTERYLLSSIDPNNDYGHQGRSCHTKAELTNIWPSGDEYYMQWGMGRVKTSQTMYLYRQFIIAKGYISTDPEKKNYEII